MVYDHPAYSMGIPLKWIDDHSPIWVYNPSLDTKHASLSTAQSIIPGTGGGNDGQMTTHLIENRRINPPKRFSPPFSAFS
jgi:hypothetical protein